MNIAPDRFTLSKMDAARRQLDCSIRLWFSDFDPVSIHTLACAAHQIISDVIKKHGGQHPLFDSIVIREERREEFREMMRKPMMFLKHADRDTYDTLEFSPLSNVIFILFSIVGLQQLGETASDYQNIFCNWLVFHDPDLINPAFLASYEQIVPVNQLDDIRKLSKHQFLEHHLQAVASIKARPIL